MESCKISSSVRSCYGEPDSRERVRMSPFTDVSVLSVQMEIVYLFAAVMQAVSVENPETVRILSQSGNTRQVQDAAEWLYHHEG